jgi:hypothetical protein
MKLQLSRMIIALALAASVSGPVAAQAVVNVPAQAAERTDALRSHFQVQAYNVAAADIESLRRSGVRVHDMGHNGGQPLFLLNRNGVAVDKAESMSAILLALVYWMFCS